jgi:hypothetical protein
MIWLSERPRKHYVWVIDREPIRRERILLLVESLLFMILWSEGIIQAK